MLTKNRLDVVIACHNPIANLRAVKNRLFGTRLMYGMFGAMEFVLPKKTKTEHWPLEGRTGKETA